MAPSDSLTVRSLALRLSLSLSFLAAPAATATATMSQTHVISSSSQNSQSSGGSNPVVGGHFRVDKKIGEGSFGVVFAGL